MNLKKGLKEGIIYFFVFWLGSLAIGGGISGAVEAWGFGTITRAEIDFFVPIVAIIAALIAFTYYCFLKKK